MPICGFNKDILDGLELFHIGLVENKITNEYKEQLEND